MGDSFKDLVVWQRAVQMSLEIYKLTSSFPASERFGLTNQLRLGLGREQYRRGLRQILQGRVLILPRPRKRFKRRGPDAACHFTRIGLRCARVPAAGRISVQRSRPHACCDDEQTEALGADFLFPIPYSLFPIPCLSHPGGQVIARPPSRCRWRCSTVWPPSGPVFTTMR
jgi:23S rRNA-intervening sequence protein